LCDNAAVLIHAFMHSRIDPNEMEINACDFEKRSSR
jgi:hypothetical protein